MTDLYFLRCLICGMVAAEMEATILVKSAEVANICALCFSDESVSIIAPEHLIDCRREHGEGQRRTVSDLNRVLRDGSDLAREWGSDD